MRWVAKLFLLFRPNTRSSFSGRMHVFIQYMECTSTLNEMNEKLRHVFLKFSATNEKYHSIIADRELNISNRRNVDGCYEAEQFSATRGAVHVVKCSYGIPSLGRALP